MAFDPDAYLASKSTFDPDAYLAKTEEKSIGGFAKNLGKDVMGTVNSLGRLGEGLLLDTGPTVKNVVTSLPGAVIEEGKRIGVGELLTGHPINAVEKLGGAFYEKPLTTFLDVAPAAGVAGKLTKAGKVARGAELAGEAGSFLDEAAQAAKAAPSLVDDVTRVAGSAPSPVNLGDEAASILKQPSQIPTEVPPGIKESLSGLKEKIPTAIKGPLDEVGDFVNQRFQKAAAKRGFGEFLGDAAIRKAQDMRIQEIGFSPGQIKTLIERKGEDWVRSLADLAKEKQVTKPVSGYHIGKNIEALEQSSGNMIGGIRDIASKRGAIHDPNQLVQAIRSQLDSKYLKGSGSSQKGAYMKALEDIKRAEPTAAGIAKAISNINEIKVGSKMTQPVGAMTDVANVASRMNNELISKFLGPKELSAYNEALRDFGAAKIMGRGRARKAALGMAGRAGVGGVMRNIKQKAMDVGGGKVMENFFDKIGPKLKQNPSLSKNLGDLSGEALSDLLSALDDAIDEIGGSVSR